MSGDDVQITIRVDDRTAAGFRAVDGRLRDMRGRFVSEGALMSGSMNRLSSSISGVKGSIIPLAAAAVPLAAAFAPVAVKAGAASLAVAAFGVAAAGQASSLKAAADAQKKYEDAVTKSGRGSKAAADAQRAAMASLAGMPEATQRAAVGFQTLKGQYQDFSDSTAKFTMAPVEKSFAVLGEIIPRLTPMVKGSSEQLDRLVTVAGGAVASPGFDAFSDRVSKFANDSLKDGVDGVIHFAQALSQGEASGPIATFMEYAERNGPALRETLTTVGDAVSTLVEAAADAGPGMLTLVNAAAGLVAALPPEVVTVLMQTAVALKAVSLAGAGAAAIAGGVATLGTRLTALGAASAAAGGGLAGMNAALNTMGTGGKAMLAAGAVGALVLATHQLSDNKGPVAVDKLATSLNALTTTGKVTGELKDNFTEMSQSVAMVSKGASDNKLAQLTSDFGTFVGISTGPGISDARKNVDAWDKSMSSLVKSGNTEQAAAQYQLLKKAWVAGGGDLDRLKKFTNDYDSALADAKFEQEMAAQSMGVFGQAAQETSAQLAAQQKASDGLRASILALNDVNRSAYDAQIGFEASLDSLSESFAKHGATLNLDTEAGRANATAMSQAAKSQDDLIASGLAAGESLGSMTKKSSELRESMMKLAVDAFDGNKAKATEYVNTLLGVPSEIKTLVKAEKDEAVTGLAEVQSAIEKTPGTKSVKVDALNGAAIAALRAVGIKTETLPDGRTRVFTSNGQSLGSIGAVTSAMNRLNGKSANTYVTTTYRIRGNPNVASGTYLGSTAGRSADGNIYTGRSYADGGMESHVAQIAQPTFRMWAEPETGGEAYIPLAQAKRPRSQAILGDVAERFGYRLEKFAGGGMSQAQKNARAGLSGSFGISHFGRMAGYGTDPFEKSLGKPADIAALVSALNGARGDIRAAFSGRTESRLLKMLDSTGNSLLKYEKKLNAVNKALDSARGKLSDLRSAASSLSSTVKGGVLSSANITRGASGDGPVTVASIMGGLTEGRDKASAWEKALADLKKRGVSKDLIEQIAEAGISGGGLETAGALLGASSSEIRSMNSLQGQISASATAAGKNSSDAVYGAAIKAQTASVTRLQKSQDKLESTMANLAKNLEKALQRALAGKAAGGIVGGAASGGIRSSMTWVGEQGPELLDLPAGSRVWSNPDSRRKAAQAPWASMLNTPRGGGGRAPADGGAPGQPLVINVNFGGHDLGQIWLDAGRSEVRAHGGSLKATLGNTRD
ncbi:phage tail protein [Streptomyces sp. NPDC127072]|uniref:phage tail protein n=1 Tax=Streptomyces sp. NPDC127072 TaxID=3347129 RepID=UPI00364B75DC